MRSRRILLMLPSYMTNDAVGNDVNIQREVLEQAGFEVAVFAEQVHPELQSTVLDQMSVRTWLCDPRTLAIIQHAIYWPALDTLLELSKCEVWIRYQNITPHEFFEPYSEIAVHASLMGRRQVKALVKSRSISRFVPASSYSSQELVRMGLSGDRSFVLPPFHRADEFAVAEQGLPPDFDRSAFNVLFVGRVSPNKGHKHLIEVVRYYRAMHGDDIQLHVVGGCGPDLASYKRELDARVRAYRLDAHVRFWQHLPFSKVVGLYKESNVFLLMSEHEGFCVPVLEAQISELPVVAYSCSAVTETLGPNQLGFEDIDYTQYAAALHVAKDKSVVNALVRNGQTNARRFTRERIRTSLLNLISETSQ